MTTVLGRDFRTTMASHFAGRLYPATFTKFTQGDIDPDDAAGGSNPTPAVYACDAIAFGYSEKDVDGTLVKKGDYKVTITLGSIAAEIEDAVAAVLDLASVTAGDLDTVIAAREPGAGGNAITVELRDDSSVDAGERVQIGTHIAFRFKPDVTTREQLESVIEASSLVDVSSGTSSPTTALTSADAFVSVALAGGVDNSVTPADVVPNPSDLVSVPPPGETDAKTGRIIGVLSITQATVTVQVRGVAE